jgi:hypothetical protein
MTVATDPPGAPHHRIDAWLLGNSQSRWVALGGNWPPGALLGVAIALPAARAGSCGCCLMSISRVTSRPRADARSCPPCSLERAHPRTAGAGCGTGFLTRSRPGILAERGGPIVRGIGSPDRSQCRSEAAGTRIDDVVVSFPSRRQACRHRHHRGPIVVCAPDRPRRRVREVLSSSILHP